MKPSPFFPADAASRPLLAPPDDPSSARRAAARTQAREARLRLCVGPPISPSAELAFWRLNHAAQRFATGRSSFEDFEPAYRCGLLQYLREPFVPLSRAEPVLERQWPAQREQSPLAWAVARFAARAAWLRAQARAEAIARGQS